MASGDLVTLQQVKDLLDISDADSDAKIAQAITDASSAIRTFLQRGIGLPAFTGTKTYAYDRSGWLDIDDATVVTAVTLDGVTLTLGSDFVLGPDRGYLTPDGPLVFEWIELAPGRGISPEMGFERNLDTMPLYALPRYSTVAVTGTFGYPGVPGDVVRAALWTVVEFVTMPQPFSSATISAYSVQQPTAIVEAIPARAQALLAPLRRGLM